jgi:hypothetical protein
VLELYKQGVIDLEQAGSFSDLVVLPLAPGDRVELDLMSIADLDGDALVISESQESEDSEATEERVEEHA